MLVLAIESSCDETAAAVVEGGRRVLSSIVASQHDLHGPFGGVVPELASRRHLSMITQVCEKALEEAGIGPGDLSAVAATRGPGLIGALLVGYSFGKAYAAARGIPFAGVNHLIAHVHTAFFSEPPPELPFVALLASGGHTALYRVDSETQMELMGQTRDDAAGEAFDKAAKAMGLGYPGGPELARLADKGEPGAVAFPRSWLGPGSLDFSFSGVKTALTRHLALHPEWDESFLANAAASFQEAVCEVMAKKALEAARGTGVGRLAVVGGVAANLRLREMVADLCRREGISLHVPPVGLCGDNAVMVASVAHSLLREGLVSVPCEDVFSKVEPD
ncbi:MAG: tRNA (adenosine(37)-N6)-threonylcarbamoyltransferase complex transferase subunit TsaD [Thermodesulfobacteriota bacterium]